MLFTANQHGNLKFWKRSFLVELPIYAFEFLATHMASFTLCFTMWLFKFIFYLILLHSKRSKCSWHHGVVYGFKKKKFFRTIVPGNHCVWRRHQSTLFWAREIITIFSCTLGYTPNNARALEPIEIPMGWNWSLGINPMYTDLG